ncbi:ribonuclease HI family protein [Patescibacteria group bacterium]|nr:ribonuclease HI family protein [Patescibacteria group bacterium]
MRKFILYTDGGARGNPGPAAAGMVVYDSEGNLIEKFSSFLGNNLTNNQAEYQAVILGLGRIQKLITDPKELLEINVEVRMDSELIVKQIQGSYRVKNPGLKPLFAKLWTLISDFRAVDFRHVPRANNKEADKLVNMELDKH